MKPSIPQGTRDFSPIVVKKRQYILNTIKSVFENYCFQPLETPAMENLTTLTGKYGEEGDKLMFKILNNGLNNEAKLEKTKLAFDNILAGRSDANITERALRYDLTIPFARYVAMNQNDIAFPFKRYQMQPVWRADRPQKGRYREFWQCDADVVGSNSLLNEAELLAIYRAAFTSLSVPEITIKINNRKILAGLANAIGASDMMMDMTIAIDKLDKIGVDGVSKELVERGFSETQVESIKTFLLINDENNENAIKALEQVIGHDETAKTGIEELRTVLALHEQITDSTWNNKVAVDFTLARGLNYYTGTIVEVKTTAVEMGSIGGGGRYDDLTGLFGLKGMSGVGVSFGIDRIYDVMEQLELFPNNAFTSTQIMFVNIHEAALPSLIQYTAALRKMNIAAEIYPDLSKFDKQMKYANKRNIPYIAIVGESEYETKTILLKDMESGEQKSVDLQSLIQIIK